MNARFRVAHLFLLTTITAVMLTVVTGILNDMTKQSNAIIAANQQPTESVQEMPWWTSSVIPHWIARLTGLGV